MICDKKNLTNRCRCEKILQSLYHKFNTIFIYNQLKKIKTEWKNIMLWQKTKKFSILNKQKTLIESRKQTPKAQSQGSIQGLFDKQA